MTKLEFAHPRPARDLSRTGEVTAKSRFASDNSGLGRGTDDQRENRRCSLIQGANRDLGHVGAGHSYGVGDQRE
jgi:hypothetical protein